MKKYLSCIIATIIVIIICSCSNKSTIPTIQVVYFKDPTTGICFSACTAGGTFSGTNTMTCVPCDSLRNVEVFSITPTNRK